MLQSVKILGCPWKVSVKSYIADFVSFLSKHENSNGEEIIMHARSLPHPQGVGKVWGELMNQIRQKVFFQNMIDEKSLSQHTAAPCQQIRQR